MNPKSVCYPAICQLYDSRARYALVIVTSKRSNGDCICRVLECADGDKTLHGMIDIQAHFGRLARYDPKVWKEICHFVKFTNRLLDNAERLFSASKAGKVSKR